MFLERTNHKLFLFEYQNIMLKYLINLAWWKNRSVSFGQRKYFIFYFVIQTYELWTLCSFIVAIARSSPEIGHIDFCTNLSTNLHRSICVYKNLINSRSYNSFLLTCSMCVIKSSGSKEISSSAAA